MADQSNMASLGRQNQPGSSQPSGADQRPQQGRSMFTVFALFTDYTDAAAAFTDLMGSGFERDDLNVILRDNVARQRVDDEDVAAVAQARSTGRPEPSDLDKFLSSRRPMRVPDMGQLIAAGPIGTTLGKAAASINGATGGLRGTLIDFGMPPETANAFVRGVENDGVIFGVRAQRDEVGQTAEILHAHDAQHVSSYP